LDWRHRVFLPLADNPMIEVFFTRHAASIAWFVSLPSIR
jgi:hypothetical protein